MVIRGRTPRFIGLLFAIITFPWLLTGCGGGGSGGSPEFAVGGSVAGLSGTGLVLQINAGSTVAVSSDGLFTFPSPIPSGSTYSVTVQTQPTGPQQTCTAANGSGTIGDANVTNVAVNCTTNTYNVGGAITGLVGTGLVLQSNGGNDLTPTGDGAFSFSTPVASGTAYQVNVASQPTFPSQSCTVTNDSGTITNADITTISVSCVTIPPSLSASVNSLTGQADTAMGAPVVNNPFAFTVDHPDVHNYFYSIAYTGTAVGRIAVNYVNSYNYNTSNPATANGGTIATAIGATISGQMNGTSLGLNSLYYDGPATLGAGTYSETVAIKACYDAQCTRQVPGSPLSIPVTYVITGNPIPIASFGYFPPVIQLESASTSAAPGTVTLNLTGANLPPNGAPRICARRLREPRVEYKLSINGDQCRWLRYGSAHGDSEIRGNSLGRHLFGHTPGQHLLRCGMRQTRHRQPVDGRAAVHRRRNRRP
jgi:hypothetical protein